MLLRRLEAGRQARDVGGADQRGVDAEASRRGHLLADLGFALGPQRQPQRPGTLEAADEALGLQGSDVGQRLADDGGLHRGGPQLADESRGLAGGGRVELVALEHEDVAHAGPREVVGRRAAQDAAADDRDARAVLPAHTARARALTPPGSARGRRRRSCGHARRGRAGCGDSARPARAARRARRASAAARRGPRGRGVPPRCRRRCDAR